MQSLDVVVAQRTACLGTALLVTSLPAWVVSAQPPAEEEPERSRFQLGAKFAWSPSGDHVQAARVAFHFVTVQGSPAVHIGPELAFGRLIAGTLEHSIESDQFWGLAGMAVTASWRFERIRLDVGGQASTIATPFDQVDTSDGYRAFSQGIDFGPGLGLLVDAAVAFGPVSLGFRADAMLHYMTERQWNGLFGGDLFFELAF